MAYVKKNNTDTNSTYLYYGVDTSLLENKTMRHFVVWYVNGAKKEEFEKWDTLSGDYNFAMNNYLTRPDVQRCILEYVKRNRDMDLIKIYNVMKENALNGDVQAANWITNFSKSDFFNENVNELENFIEGLSLDE